MRNVLLQKALKEKEALILNAEEQKLEYDFICCTRDELKTYPTCPSISRTN